MRSKSCHCLYITGVIEEIIGYSGSILSIIIEEKRMFNSIHSYRLTVGDTIGCSVHKDGTLHYYINGIDKGISWDNKLPTNQTMYGVVGVWGHHKRIRSLFHYGKYTSVLT